jgi:L-fuculose-phosphate aldolase
VRTPRGWLSSTPGPPPPLLPIDDPWAISDFILARLKAGGLGGEDPRAALVRCYRWLRQYGCNDSHSGNASVRVGDHFYVTPTGAGADTLTPERLIRCPIEGELPPGVSLDAPLHRAVYLARPQARCVLHSHGPYSVAASLSKQAFRPVDFEGQLYFPTVPNVVVDYGRYVAEAPGLVARALAEHPIALVCGHGVYAWGDLIDLAYKRTCSLELSARTYLIARQTGIL